MQERSKQSTFLLPSSSSTILTDSTILYLPQNRLLLLLLYPLLIWLVLSFPHLILGQNVRYPGIVVSQNLRQLNVCKADWSTSSQRCCWRNKLSYAIKTQRMANHCELQNSPSLSHLPYIGSVSILPRSSQHNFFLIHSHFQQW